MRTVERKRIDLSGGARRATSIGETPVPLFFCLTGTWLGRADMEMLIRVILAGRSKARRSII